MLYSQENNATVANKNPPTAGQMPIKATLYSPTACPPGSQRRAETDNTIAFHLTKDNKYGE